MVTISTTSSKLLLIKLSISQGNNIYEGKIKEEAGVKSIHIVETFQHTELFICVTKGFVSYQDTCGDNTEDVSRCSPSE